MLGRTSNYSHKKAAFNIETSRRTYTIEKTTAILSSSQSFKYFPFTFWGFYIQYNFLMASMWYTPIDLTHNDVI